MENYFVNDVREARDFLVKADFIVKSDAEINDGYCEAISDKFSKLPAGTLIHSPGYATVKEKSLDGSWVKL